MNVQVEDGSLHQKLTKLLTKSYQMTGKEPDTVYLGYHEWDSLRADTGAGLYLSVDSPKYYYQGCEVIPVCKNSHIGIAHNGK